MVLLRGSWEQLAPVATSTWCHFSSTWQKGPYIQAVKCPAPWQLWFFWQNSSEYMQLVKGKDAFYKQHKSHTAQWHTGSCCFWFELVSEHEWQGVKYWTHVQSFRKTEAIQDIRSQSMKSSLTARRSLKSQFQNTKMIPMVVLQNVSYFSVSRAHTHSLEFMLSHGPTLTVQLIPGQTL